MINIDHHIFRAYDIRGIAGTQLTPEVCKLIAQGFAAEVRERYDMEHPRIAVGRDARTHGPELEKAVIEGLVASGCHVLLIGPTPSPVNYFTVCDKQLEGGVQLTASHNPAEYNGLKLQTRNSEAFSGEDLQRLLARIREERFASGEGSIETTDAIDTYVKHVSDIFDAKIDALKVVIDAGNGIGGPAYVRVLKAVGCEVIELYTEPDGTFPNHPADPSKRETLKDLQATVVRERADCGLAFDGDGDRLGLVDETGAIRSADDILLLLAKDHLSRHAGAPVVFTVSNSGALETEVRKWGGKPVMCIVGHSFVEHAMHENHAKLGGEQSGHFFCGEDYFAYDDAAVAGLRVLAILSAAKRPLSELFAEFPKTYQAPEYRPHCGDHQKQEVIERITAHFAKTYPVNTMDGVRIDFGDGAWAGIRKSNTSPCISVCIEARSENDLERAEAIVRSHLSTYDEITD